MSDAPPALRVTGVAKSFGSTRALRGVSFDVAPGTVHALVGGNGSGKSTLIKVLAGVLTADAGSFEVDGVTRDAATITSAQAREDGLRFVHQQASTFAELSVAENLAVGRGFERGRGGRIDWRAQRRRAAEVLGRFGIDARPDAPLSTLTPAKQTMVAIARALQDQQDAHRGLLVLDEPTASLPATEVRVLLDALRSYSVAGQTIVYVSHRLEEVLATADATTVLRDGAVVATRKRDGLTHDALVELMMGRRIERYAAGAARTSGLRLLTAEHLRGAAVADASLTVDRGEVVGVAGLLGSGRTSLLRLLFGAAAIDGGSATLDGEPLRPRSSRAAMAAGVALVPEDRARDAAFPELNVRENLSAASIPRYWRRGLLRRGAERSDARGLIASYLIRSASEEVPLASLSGGNQQKVILARWLRREPRLLLLDEPTQGVDIGARTEIYGLVRRAADAGAGVLVVSSDFDELATLCDRVVILRRGRTVDEVSGADLDETHLNHLVLDTEALIA